ncbi:MAG: EAL domain-containing protein [Chromatiaceae bacterium]|nr:EAL domain-containing protein [Chromatiaceae bacterium]
MRSNNVNWRRQILLAGTEALLVAALLLLSLVLLFEFHRWIEPLVLLSTLVLVYPVRWGWDRHRMALSIRSEHRRAATLLETLSEAVISLNADFTISYLNPAAESLTGWSATDALGKSCAQVLDAMDESHQRTFCEAIMQWDLPGLAKYWTLSLPSGELKLVRASCARSGNPHRGEAVVITLSDLTVEQQLQEAIRHQATHDPLTRLPNRTLVYDRLQQAITRLQRSDQGIAVLVIDLDDFKKINEGLGHAAGDILLRNIAERLGDSIRHEDTVGRLGSDEFVIILENLQDREDVTSIAEKLSRAVRKPVHIFGHEFFVNISVGIAHFPGDGDTVEDLLRNANLAMYRGKRGGGSSIISYERAMNDSAMQRFTLENDLQRALRQQEFRLLYQPIIDMASGNMVGVEALIRWQHPQRGLLTPDKFIPSAESNGLITPIGEWVINQASADLDSWMRVHRHRFRVAVNLSPRQLKDKRLPGKVAALLQLHGIKPEQIELEITEEVLMSDSFGDLATLQRLRDMGLKIAIDDFGTGYSSFSYLKRMDVSRLKIDRSFVKDLTAGSSDAAIVQAIISMARSLRMELTAEGIETVAQARFFELQGNIAAQGFYFSQPTTAEEIAQLLAQTAPDGSCDRLPLQLQKTVN